MATGLYPGQGAVMALASSNPQEPVWASMRTPTIVIPSGSSSVGFAVNAGLTTSINVLFATAPSGTAFNVMYDVSPTFATEYVLSAVAAVALQKAYTWSTDGLIELDGFIRITNAGGQNITKATIQQRARMDG